MFFCASVPDQLAGAAVGNGRRGLGRHQLSGAVALRDGVRPLGLHAVYLHAGIDLLDGSRDAGKILDKLVLYSGGHLAGKIVINAPFNSIRARQETNPKIHRIASDTGDRLYNAISSRKAYPLQDIYHKIVFAFGIKPFVLRKGKEYNGVITKWKGMEI